MVETDTATIAQGELGTTICIPADTLGKKKIIGLFPGLTMNRFGTRAKSFSILPGFTSTRARDFKEFILEMGNEECHRQTPRNSGKERGRKLNGARRPTSHLR